MTQMVDKSTNSRVTAQRTEDDAVVEAPILVAVDMSEASRAALLWACDYSAKTNRPVTALHVVHDPAEAPGKYRRDASSPLRPVFEVAKEMLSDFLAQMHADHPDLEPLSQVDGQLVDGLPAHTIVNEARRLNASLVVLGSRGETGLQRMMNGSIAQKVMQLSPTAVTIVKTPGL